MGKHNRLLLVAVQGSDCGSPLIHTYMRTYVHTYIHTYIHTQYLKTVSILQFSLIVKQLIY
jgi:hypothetical protein